MGAKGSFVDLGAGIFYSKSEKTREIPQGNEVKRHGRRQTDVSQTQRQQVVFGPHGRFFATLGGGKNDQRRHALRRLENILGDCAMNHNLKRTVFLSRVISFDSEGN